VSIAVSRGKKGKARCCNVEEGKCGQDMVEKKSIEKRKRKEKKKKNEKKAY